MKTTFIRFTMAVLVVLILAINVVSAQPPAPFVQPDQGQSGVLALPKEKMSSLERRLADQAEREAAEKAALDTPGAINLGPRVAPANDNLANATEITLPFSGTVVDIADATTEAGKLAFCGGNNNDVWFKLTLAAPTALDLITYDSNYDTVMAIFSGSSTPASEADLSFVRCSDNYDSYNVSLPAGTYYVRISDYGTSPAGSGAELNLVIETTGKPQRFSQAVPYDDTYALAPSVFMWGESNNATTYDYALYDVTGVETEVFTLPGLTPADDADEMDCVNYYYCVLTLEAAEKALITDLKDYRWEVVAKNALGSLTALHYSYYNLFSTDFSQLPGEPYLYEIYPYVQLTDPTLYSWSTVTDATSYDLVVDQTLPAPAAGVFSLTDLTPADDSDALTCEYFDCVLDLAPAEARALRALADGGTFEANVTAKNDNGGTVSFSPVEFAIDSTPAPQDFGLYGFSLIYVPSNLSSMSWSISDYATSYNLLVQRTAPAAADVFNLTGLTPAADSDALTCSTYYCNYTLTNPETTFTTGDYSWEVTAVNANGSLGSYSGPDTFAVNADVAFESLTPADNAIFTDGSEIPSFTWEQVSAAGTTVISDWTLYFYNNYTSFSIRYLTEAADTDPLTCTGGTCTFVATGTRLGMKRNIHSWYPYVSVNYVSTLDIGTTVSATETFQFTVGDVPTDFYVSNYNFETYAAGKLPTDWKVNGTLTGSKVKCNKEDKIVAYAGDCAWLAKGVTTNGSLSQALKTDGLLAGDTVTMYGYINGKNVTAGKVQLKITLANNTKVKLKLTGTDTAGGYMYYDDSETLAADATKAKVKISNLSNGGKMYVDYLWVYAILGDGASALVPLPLPLEIPADSGLGSRSENGLGSRK